MSLFRGSGVALVTPFNGKEVDFAKLQQLIEWHIAEGTDALIVCGTTGESATLTTEEKQKIIAFSVKVAAKRIPIIAGTGGNATDASIKLSVFAEEAQADGLLLVTPYYNKPTQKGLYAHFVAIAEAVKLPIILYNVPSRTGVNLLPETVLALSKIENIQGVKEASGDISQIAKVIDLCPKNFIVFSGNDDQTIPVLALGGQGVISVTANILPKTIHLICKDYLEGNYQIALESFLKLRNLNQALFVESNPAPVKKAMNLMGMNVGGCRLPLVDLEPNSVMVLEKAMREYGLLGGNK